MARDEVLDTGNEGLAAQIRNLEADLARLTENGRRIEEIRKAEINALTEEVLGYRKFITFAENPSEKSISRGETAKIVEDTKTVLAMVWSDSVKELESRKETAEADLKGLEDCLAFFARAEKLSSAILTKLAEPMMGKSESASYKYFLIHSYKTFCS